MADATPDPEGLYTRHRRSMLSVAYRMLGSWTEAEDAVQDVFTKIQQVDMAAVACSEAYLVRLVTNRCLNPIRSRRDYVGPWLPEPQVTGLDVDPLAHVERSKRSPTHCSSFCIGSTR
jgi:RNA polymerase sigma-70 factor (ECF subfamily)